jgi:hypothetical protein
MSGFCGYDYLNIKTPISMCYQILWVLDFVPQPNLCAQRSHYIKWLDPKKSTVIKLLPALITQMIYEQYDRLSDWKN